MSEEHVIHSIDRELYGESFISFIESMGFSHYGYYTPNGIETVEDAKVMAKIDEHGVYRNDVFELSAFWWNDCTCGKEPSQEFLSGADYHKPDCMVYRPNFWYKPNDWKLEWYKYPLRGNTCNRSITPEEFLKMLNHCKKAFYE